MQRIALFLFIIAITLTGNISADQTKLNTDFKSAIVLDVKSGRYLYAYNPHKKVIPASLVKMMLALVVLEKQKKGEISLSEKTTVSALTSKIGGHQVYLKQGEVFELKELLKAVIIGSANDAAHAIAVHVAGTQDAFVQLMNQRASELGMNDTTFSNVHGLPPNRRKGQKDNSTSAYDLTILATALMQYPLILNWSSTRLDSFRNGTFQLLNTNHRFLKGYEGADGLKTGYHPRGAGFSMVGTAVRDGRRLVAVVLGSKNSRERLKAVEMLLDMGFNDNL